jgi:O-antigen/teichoic acid export membrane protein
MLAFAAFDDLLLALLQGFGCYRNMAIAQVLRAGLRLSLTALFLVALGFGLTGLIWSWSISFAVSAVYQYVHLPFPPTRTWNPALIKEMLGFGWPLYLTGYLWFGSTRVHVLLLATLAGPTSVGLYAAAARIPEALQNITDAYIRVYFPTVTNLLSKGQRQAACAMLDSSVRLVAFASALAALTAVVFQREITTLLFSDKYAAASPVFALLMLALNLTAVVNLMGYTLTAAGHPRDSLMVDVVRAAGNTIGDLALIPLLGVVGSAAAAVVAGGAGVPGALWSLRLRGLRATSIWPAVRQVVVLWGCSALWWFFQPESLLYKAAIVLLFLGLNTRTRSLVRDDVALVVPARLLPRRSVSA